MHLLYRRLLFSLLCLLLAASVAPQLSAVLLAQTVPFAAPTTISVHMYQLDEDSGNNLGIPCTTVNKGEFGCTDYINLVGVPSPHPYPYSGSEPAVNIDTDYLLDVVPGEMNPRYSPATAVKVQAIAARTYSYYHIFEHQKGNTSKEINNSTSFQLFIPYRYEKQLGGIFPDNVTNPCASTERTTYQNHVCNAVESHQYISSSSNDEPAHSEFSADRLEGDTVQGGEVYLTSVQDGISTSSLDCTVNSQDQFLIEHSHGRGMLQRGASRWALGNRCWTKDRGNDPWSVRWDRPEQILTHYYTGVHIRDTATKAVLMPNYRWGSLQINWGPTGRKPPDLHSGTSYPISMQVQNTGVSTWTCVGGTQFKLDYRWQRTYRDDDRTITEQQPSSNRADVCGLIPGAAQTVNLTINDLPAGWDTNTASLYFDIYFLPYNSSPAMHLTFHASRWAKDIGIFLNT